MRTEAAKPYSRLVAVLGPTNTGKTHRAISRMLEHPTGMLGLPLRLLAREVYDRLTRELGEQSVALVTGEEKRVGQRARYWVCTVEAMPLTQEVDFLAVDEVQLAAHPQRGHIFTDRLLHARGRVETWFLGSDTMRPLLRALVPTATIESHPRFSTLKGKGQSRLSALPSRSAVVAFSVPEVYRLAERFRHRRGGAAVVLGALSPRARNAQVALYEAREVDYLVATDAIGMGLNLAIRHVAFAGLSKFDGREERPLRPAELAQIAGRAGRHVQNGSFGTLAPIPPLLDGLRRCIEEHRFENVQQVCWRNSDLCMDNVGELLSSLRAPPQRRYFSRLSQGSDLEALERLENDVEVRRRAQGAAAVELLWQACQIPDYRQWLPELHAELVKEIYLQLTGSSGVLDQDWLATSIDKLDDVSGDIDALTARIASVRTWTYLSNHSAWLPSPAHWVERTHELEDRLSDALHERLVERFVARRRATVETGAPAPLAFDEGPALGGSPFAVLQRLREQMSEPARPTLESWVADLITAPHERFRLDATGLVYDGDECLGRLARGASLLKPEFRLTYEGLSSGQHLRLSRRLLAWARDLVQEVVGALEEPPAEPWSAAGRGVIYQLQQNLGTLPAQSAGPELAALTLADRQSLAALGVRINRDFLYLVDAVKPHQRLARLALTRVFSRRDDRGLPSLMQSVSFRLPKAVDVEWLSQVGFVVLGHRVIRVEVADRVSRELQRCAKAGAFALPGKLANWLGPGASAADAGDLARALGYRCGDDGLYRRARRRRRGKRHASSTP
jgi:ATP-dependent RNA helicase SUPV3L1/SUV3